jgi:para-aminobenzoate synthetase component I
LWSETATSSQLDNAIRAMRSLVPAPSGQMERRIHQSRSCAQPEQVAELLLAQPGFVWLDGNASRHLLFSDPIATISCDGKEALIQAAGRTLALSLACMDILDAALRSWQWAGGAMLVGFISYDVVDELEKVGPVPPLSPAFPRLHLGLYDSALVYDDTGWSISGTEAWCPPHAAVARLSKWEDLLARAEALCQPDETATRWEPRFIEQRGDSKFLHGVRSAIDRIHKGDFFQVNLCRLLSTRFPAELAWPLYLRMRRLNPARFGAYVSLTERSAILSMSPELFLTVNDGLVESHPIKGTRTREMDENSGRAASGDLLQSEKDASELAMIVDVVRNDLSRVCKTGSVKVLEHQSLLTLPTVLHTYSRVAGELKGEKTIADLLRASFPPASVTGAPKIAAIEGALQEEGTGRGPCMGAIGWIGMDGSLELSVAIRTAFTNDDQLFYLAGCGITADSIPQSELAESRAKASAFLRALA